MLKRLPGLLAALTTLTVMALLLHQRAVQHLANVDDYLYARQTDTFWQAVSAGRIGVVDAWKLFGVNSPLVPTLASPLAAFDRSPGTFVLVQLPLALGLLAATAALARRTGAPLRWLIAAAAVLMAPTLTYTAMLSFAVASSLCTVGVLVTYLASRRLRERRASLLLGLAVGLLSLSRVVALVYLAAVLLPVLADLVLDRAERGPRAKNLGIATGIAILVAAPWWLTAGPKAMKYLLDAGYSNGSLFTADSSFGQRELDRLTHTADETGWLLAAVLLLGYVLGVVASLAAVRREATESARANLLVASTVPLGLLLLGTSSNAGTAFALPFEVLAVVVAASGLRHVVTQRVATGGLAAAVALSAAMVFTDGAPTRWHGHELWLAGLPARAQQQAALGCRCPIPDLTRLNKDVYSLLRDKQVLVLRDDALVNPESLRFLAQLDGRELRLDAPPGTAVDQEQLSRADVVLAGRTPAPYLAVDLSPVSEQLTARGFVRVLSEQLSAANTVEVWAKP